MLLRPRTVVLLLLACACACGDDGPGDGTEASTTAESSAPTDGGGGEAAYDDCAAGDVCAMDLFCQLNYSQSGNGRWCSSSCVAGDDSDCPAAPGGAAATPVCIMLDDAPSCALSCVLAPDGCPAGMVCRNTLCAWPFS